MFRHGLLTCAVCVPIVLVFGCPGVSPPPAGLCGGVTCASGETCENDTCVPEAAGGDPTAGATFFANNGCAACHGADATGGDGPNLRGVDADTIFARLSGAVQHEINVPGVTQQDAENVAAWLASLEP